MADTPATTDTAIADLAPTLARLRAAQRAAIPDRRQRLDDLARLRAAVKAWLPRLNAAMQADFGQRSRHECAIADGMTILHEIDFLRRRLRRWMRPERRAVGHLFWPGRAEIRHVPLGVVGVISPWNYPVNLALIPLATAIAAGNHVYLKPSEITANTSSALAELLAEVFPSDRVAVALGGPEVAAGFASLPFDHLLFTGSTAVGRKVMAAAAPNLTPVTLELGGKSPAIVGEDYPLAKVAARLATGKWLNAGQTCIAPDYVLVPRQRQAELVAALRAEVQVRYPDLEHNPDYTRVINAAQYGRLQSYLADARARGHEVQSLIEVDPARAEALRLLPPTLVLDPAPDSAVMQDEIFGPILPVIGYDSLDQAIGFIDARDRPLALYHFESRRDRIEQVLSRCVAGGVTVNDTLMHNAVSNLPFGGVGPSGMGHYHGREGFLTFSKAMPVFHQARIGSFDLFKPPYRRLADWLVGFLTR